MGGGVCVLMDSVSRLFPSLHFAGFFSLSSFFLLIYVSVSVNEAPTKPFFGCFFASVVFLLPLAIEASNVRVVVVDFLFDFLLLL